MSGPIVRDQRTWLCYLLLAFYGFMLNILGPLTPFLKADLELSYTVSSLHFTAFALGILFVGFFGQYAIASLGRGRSLWVGAFGLSLGSLLLLVGKTPLVTIAGTFLMGAVGSLILAVVPSVLAGQHGEHSAVVLSEANVVASLASVFAPQAVGWSDAWLGSWRPALLAAAAIPVLLLVFFRSSPAEGWQPGQRSESHAGQRLPAVYWFFWLLLMLGVAVEFCMVFWSADYLETSLLMSRDASARWVSVFLAGMILGRLGGSRLVKRFAAQGVVLGCTLLAGAGFLVYWNAASPVMGIVGLFLTGLGVSSLYPLLLSLAIGSARGAVDQAGSRSALASGVAIFFLPLLLGRLADEVTIRPAYGLVAVLLAVLFILMLAAVARSYITAKAR